MLAQDTYARKQYAHKHYGRTRRLFYLTALAVNHLIRGAGARVHGQDSAARREGALIALRTLASRAEPPFGAPPTTAVSAPVDG
jgi:hypothetical protein